MRLSPRPVLLAVVALLLGLVVPLAANPAGADPRHQGGRRRPLAAGGGHRPELLLRHGRPVRERRHRQRQRRAGAATRCVSGFDPTEQGLLQRRRPQGAAAASSTTSRASAPPPIWLTPSFKNKAVQLEDGPRPATTATGSPTSPRSTRTSAPTPTWPRWSQAAHARGMKVYFDIITNHTADVIGYEEGAAPGVRLQGRRALPDGGRHAVRRPRLRRHEHLPGARPARRRFPYHPGARPGRAEPQGAGLAQRRDALPQPRQHDVHRRELPVRRLLRPRRPVHREPAASSTA